MGCCSFKVDPNGFHKPDTSIQLQNLANRSYFVIGQMINHPYIPIVQNNFNNNNNNNYAQQPSQEDVVVRFGAFENGQIQVNQIKGIYSIPTQQFTYVQYVEQLFFIPREPGVYKVDMNLCCCCACCFNIENMFAGSSPGLEWLLITSGQQNSSIQILVDTNCLGNVAAYYVQIQQALAQNNYQGYYYHPSGISQSSIILSTQIMHSQMAANGANPANMMMMLTPEMAEINQIVQTNQMLQMNQMSQMNQMPQMVPQYVQLAAQPGAQPNQQFY